MNSFAASPKSLNIVVALDCEARALIDYYKLVKLGNSSQFNIYANADRSIHLIVSGIGKVNVAAATGYIHAYTGARSYNCFLNVGIAGDETKALSELFVIHKITDQSSQQSWYPCLPKKLDLPSAAIVTIDKVQTDYPQSCLVDMEASAFFQAATHFVTQEQVQIVKFISDNVTTGKEHINKSIVKQWCSDNIANIDKVVSALIDLSQQEAQIQSPDLQRYLEKWHFTQYQQHQLREYLRRWEVLCEEPAIAFLKQETSAKTVLQALQNRLQTIEYSWP